MLIFIYCYLCVEFVLIEKILISKNPIQKLASELRFWYCQIGVKHLIVLEKDTFFLETLWQTTTIKIILYQTSLL
jgi:hypothetical protein